MNILAIDQGTTGSRAIVYAPDGSIVSQAYREFTQHYPRQGWVEHDAEEIWQSVETTIREAVAESGGDIAAVGITNQRETTVVWDRETGLPIHNAIVWQCRRTADLCRQFEPHTATITAKTGLPLDPYFSATKIRWILDNVDHPDPSRLLFGTIDSWLLWKLTNQEVHATDYTNASRTLLFTIDTRNWDQELLDLFGIPATMLPEVRAPMQGFGSIKAIKELDGVPVASMVGDQQAALFGQCCFEEGDMKNTYGTGCFMVMNTGTRRVHSSNGLLTTLGVDAEGNPCYCLEGSVFIAGAAVQWLRDELGIISNARESEALARKLSSNEGVYLVPAFSGLGTPHWDMEARGTLVGLTRGSGKNHLARAALESIAYQCHDVFQAMEADSGIRPETLVVDGGAVGNSFLMQFQADMLQAELLVPENRESTSLGAAYMAGLASGIWNSAGELKAMRRSARHYQPGMDNATRNRNREGWNKALLKTLAR